MFKYFNIFFGVSSTPSSYIILCSYFLFLAQVFFFLIGLLVLFDYILWAFSSSRNLYAISPSQNFTSALDTFFVISISCYIVFMMLSSIGFIYNSGELINGNLNSSEVIVSLVASQWYWNVQVNTDVLNPFSLMNYSHNTENISIYSSNAMKRVESSNVIILPVNTSILLKGTSSDVIHSFGIPSSGIKFDCVPGRTQMYHVVFTKEGYYDAHCYELCGANHAHMQLTIAVVSQKDYFCYILLQNYQQFKA